MVHQTDEDTGIYEIGAVAELIGEHPETLRVWERNGLVRPDRSQYRRRYSNNDLKRLRFIKQLLDEGGLNLAGIRLVTQMYPCWYIRRCKEEPPAAARSGSMPPSPAGRKKAPIAVSWRI